MNPEHSMQNMVPATLKRLLAVALIGLILSSHSAIGAGGLEIEVGDVPGNDKEPLMGTGSFPYLQLRHQPSNPKQDDMENSRLKALDEKLRKALEAGNRTPADSCENGSGLPTPGMDPTGTEP